MTKVGEGKFQPPDPKSPEEMLRKSVKNFKQYLNDYDNAFNHQEKEILRDKMHAELSLMSKMAEACNKEIRNQERKVVKDFSNFQASPYDSDTEKVLKHDISTLGESLEH